MYIYIYVYVYVCVFSFNIYMYICMYMYMRACVYFFIQHMYISRINLKARKRVDPTATTGRPEEDLTQRSPLLSPVTALHSHFLRNSSKKETQVPPFFRENSLLKPLPALLFSSPCLPKSHLSLGDTSFSSKAISNELYWASLHLGLGLCGWVYNGVGGQSGIGNAFALDLGLPFSGNCMWN